MPSSYSSGQSTHGSYERKTVDNVNLDKIRPGEPIRAHDFRAIAADAKKNHNLGDNNAKGFVDENFVAQFVFNAPIGRWIPCIALDSAPMFSEVIPVNGDYTCGELLLRVRKISETLPSTGLVLTNLNFPLTQGHYGWVILIDRQPRKGRVKKKGHAPNGRVPPKL